MASMGFQFYREREWAPADEETYANVWQRYGGSVATHPLVIRNLSDLTGIPVRYLVHKNGRELDAAIATWGRFLALSREGLERYKKMGVYDLGNAEFILPISDQTHIKLRHSARFISVLHKGRIHDLKKQSEALALAKGSEEFSRKFLYNRRRELRLLEEAGGTIKPISAYSSDELAVIYLDLFRRRWGFSAPAANRVGEVFELMRQFMTGSLILLEDSPIAFQVLYRVESPDWISVEYINGGLDPMANRFSPGSVLTYANLQSAWEDAENRGKCLRYSFGRLDHEYKKLWCRSEEAYQAGWRTVQKQRIYKLRAPLGKLKRKLARSM